MVGVWIAYSDSSSYQLHVVHFRGKGKLWKDDSKWGHDKFDPMAQAPKSRQELIAMYGYDIMQHDKPPENPPKNLSRR